MAKKRAKKTKAKARKIKPKQKLEKQYKIAFWLGLVSAILLFLAALLAVMSPRVFLSVSESLGNPMTLAQLMLYAAIWGVLGALVLVSTFRLERYKTKSEAWLLLLIGILVVIAGLLLQGVLAIIAAILYLGQKARSDKFYK